MRHGFAIGKGWLLVTDLVQDVQVFVEAHSGQSSGSSNGNKIALSF
jgi:hypothetical protein